MVPKLRFKEFDDCWAQCNIQDLVNDSVIDKPMDGNHGELHPVSVDYVDNGIPFIMASDIIDGKIDFIGCKKISLEQANSLGKCEQVSHEQKNENFSHLISMGYQ